MSLETAFKNVDKMTWVYLGVPAVLLVYGVLANWLAFILGFLFGLIVEHYTWPFFDKKRKEKMKKEETK